MSETLECRVREAVAFAALPCATVEYTGTEKSYLVINYSTLPDAYADDAPWCERMLVQLHLYCPPTLNTAELRRTIKRALHDAGFSYPSTQDVSDSTGQHVVFEFEGVEDVDGEL